MKTENTQEYGNAWRVLAHKNDLNVEMENQGTFDELVVDDWLHVEQMDNNIWWLRVADVRIIVTLHADAAPSVDVERGFYAPPKGSTQTRE